MMGRSTCERRFFSFNQSQCTLEQIYDETTEIIKRCNYLEMRLSLRRYVGRVEGKETFASNFRGRTSEA